MQLADGNSQAWETSISFAFDMFNRQATALVSNEKSKSDPEARLPRSLMPLASTRRDWEATRSRIERLCVLNNYVNLKRRRSRRRRRRRREREHSLMIVDRCCFFFGCEIIRKYNYMLYLFYKCYIRATVLCPFLIYLNAHKRLFHTRAWTTLANHLQNTDSTND